MSTSAWNLLGVFVCLFVILLLLLFVVAERIWRVYFLVFLISISHKLIPLGLLSSRPSYFLSRTHGDYTEHSSGLLYEFLCDGDASFALIGPRRRYLAEVMADDYCNKDKKQESKRLDSPQTGQIK